MEKLHSTGFPKKVQSDLLFFFSKNAFMITWEDGVWLHATVSCDNQCSTNNCKYRKKNHTFYSADLWHVLCLSVSLSLSIFISFPLIPFLVYFNVQLNFLFIIILGIFCNSYQWIFPRLVHTYTMLTWWWIRQKISRLSHSIFQCVRQVNKTGRKKKNITKQNQWRNQKKSRVLGPQFSD